MRIKREEVESAQQEWADAIIEIGKNKNDRPKYLLRAAQLVDELYAYERGEVLFKPTRAFQYQFRFTRESAISYFVGGNENYPNDDGFALQPWINARFDNKGIVLDEKRAIAMGNYYFTGEGGDEIKVEFTIGYVKTSSGKLKIELHHSSFPYDPNR